MTMPTQMVKYFFSKNYIKLLIKVTKIVFKKTWMGKGWREVGVVRYYLLYSRVMVYWLTAQCLTRVARTLVVNRGDHRKDPIQHPHHATHLWLIFLRTHDVCSTTVLCSFPSARGKIPRITQFVLGMYSRYCQQISSLQVETACVLYTLLPR